MPFAAFFRVLPARSWLAIGAVAVVITLALAIYFAGRGDERADNDAEDQRAQSQASTGRETAATERTLDTSAITDRQKERDHAAEQIPDSLPDHRELRRRCRQLRDAGRDLPACRGLAG